MRAAYTSTASTPVKRPGTTSHQSRSPSALAATCPLERLQQQRSFPVPTLDPALTFKWTAASALRSHSQLPRKQRLSRDPQQDDNTERLQWEQSAQRTPKDGRHWSRLKCQKARDEVTALVIQNGTREQWALVELGLPSLNLGYADSSCRP